MSIVVDEFDTGEYDAEFGDAWDIDVLCEVCKHVHGGEEVCTTSEPARRMGRSCGDPRCCSSPR